MLESLKRYLIFGTHFCGLEHTTINGENTIFLALLKSSRKALDFKKTSEFKTVEDVCSVIPKKQHVFLLINNEKVLHKSVELDTLDSNRLLNAAFPNIDINAFYFEILRQNNRSFVSICRKEDVQGVIEAYHKHGISVIGISLGNQLISSLQSYFEKEEIFTSNTKIRLSKGYITSQEYLTNFESITYTINSLKVDNNYLLSLSGALQPILKNSVTTSNADDLKLSLLNRHFQLRFFRVFTKFSLLFFFVALLINFFIFSRYHNDVNSLTQGLQSNSNSIQLIGELNDSVLEKEKVVSNMLKTKSSKSTFYTNAIVQSLPKSILLKEINYQPLLKRIKANKPIEIENDKIEVSGTSNHSDTFSTWVSSLESEDWVKKVVINYSEGSDKKSEFKLLLEILYDN